jgi:hypothetical protein
MSISFLVIDCLSWLTSYSDDGEGCEDNAGSIEDRWLTILISIRELVSGFGLLIFYILYGDKVVITHYCLQHQNIVNVKGFHL